MKEPSLIKSIVFSDLEEGRSFGVGLIRSGGIPTTPHFWVRVARRLPAGGFSFHCQTPGWWGREGESWNGILRKGEARDQVELETVESGRVHQVVLFKGLKGMLE